METQKIIITGGATRIGAAIAENLANDKNQITIHYNKSKKKAKQTLFGGVGPKVSPVSPLYRVVGACLGAMTS